MSGGPRNRPLEASFSGRLFLATAAAMIAAAALSIVYTLGEFTTHLKPFLAAKAEVVAAKVAGDVEYALAAGVPADRLRGVEEFMAALIGQHPEIADLRLVPGPVPPHEAPAADAGAATADTAAARLQEQLGVVAAVLTGRPLDAGRVEVPVREPDGTVTAHVTARLSGAYLLGQMQNVFFDSLVILVAVSLVALEIVVVTSGYLVTEPVRRLGRAVAARAAGDLGPYPGWHGRGELGRMIGLLNRTNQALRHRVGTLAGGASAALRAGLDAFAARYGLTRASAPREATIIDARIPLFVFSVAEELQKSFLPLFVGEFYRPTDLFDRSIMVGLPISAFMFVIAAITPFAGQLVDRFGNRPLFLAGLVPAIGGYLLCYVAQSGNDIVLARSLTAVGYAVIIISSQSYFAAVLTKENRARGMATFVGVLMAGTMCGTAIGGILADWLGYKPVFLVSILLAGVAGALGYLMLDPGVREQPARAAGGARQNPLVALLRNSRFVMIVLFCAIPAKIVLTGFLYLFVPIYLASLESTQSEIGRIMMLYSLIIIPISPLAARFADRIGNNLGLVIAATVASGLVLMGLHESDSVGRVLVVVAALGIAHALLKAPLIVAAMEAAERSTTVTRTAALSLLRTSERIGSVIGPVIVAAMMVVLDYQTTSVLLGAGIMLIGLAMAILTFLSGRTLRAGDLADA